MVETEDGEIVILLGKQRELPGGGRQCFSQNEWTPEGDLNVSREDGAAFRYQSLRMVVRTKRAQCVKPGGTAGEYSLLSQQ